MSRKTSKGKAVPALPAIPKELIDQLVNGPMSAESVVGVNALPYSAPETKKPRCIAAAGFLTVLTISWLAPASN